MRRRLFSDRLRVGLLLGGILSQNSCLGFESHGIFAAADGDEEFLIKWAGLVGGRKC